MARGGDVYYILIWLYVYIYSFFLIATNIWCNLITAFLHWTLNQTTYSKADLLIVFSHQTKNWSFITMNFHKTVFAFSVPRCSQYQVSTSMGAVVLAAVFPLKQHLSPELSQQNMFSAQFQKRLTMFYISSPHTLLHPRFRVESALAPGIWWNMYIYIYTYIDINLSSAINSA